MKYIIFAGLVFVLGFFMLGYYHEQSHIEIYRSYGIDAHAEYWTHFPDFVTVADEPCPTDECQLAHNITEVVGYHLTAFYFAISLGLFIIIILLQMNLDIKLWMLENDR